MERARDKGGVQAPLTVWGLQCTLFLPVLKLLQQTETVQLRDAISQFCFSHKMRTASMKCHLTALKLNDDDDRHPDSLSAFYPVKFDWDANVNALIATDKTLKRCCVQQQFLSQEKATE